MNNRNWAFLFSLVGLFVFGGLILGYGYVGFWVLAPQVSHTAAQSPSQYVQTYLVVGAIGTVISVAILAKLILTREKGHIAKTDTVPSTAELSNS
jgi:Kef-type K+ transport system membrane component KefB